MTRTSIFVAAALCATTLLGAAAQSPPDIVLPADPATVVISLDSHSYWSDQSRTNQGPLMSIRADGTITTHSGGTAGPQSSLAKSELQELLRFLIQDQSFFSLNSVDIRMAIDTIESRTGIGVGISDAAETTVHVRTAERDHEVRFYASAFYAMRYPPSLYPELKSLGQLRAVETKLIQIMETQKAGGQKVVLDALAEGNAYLAKEYPQVVPFAISELQRANSGDPYRTLTFFRTVAPGESATLEVTIRQAAQTNVRFSEQKLPDEFLRLLGPVVPPK